MEDMLAAEAKRAEAMLAMFAPQAGGALQKPPEMFGGFAAAPSAEAQPHGLGLGGAADPPWLRGGVAPEPGPAHRARAASPPPSRKALRGPPAQEFEVVQAEVTVRAAPTASSKTCGFKRRGDRFRALEETFDGWVRLVDGAGWVLRNAHTDQGRCAIEPVHQLQRLAAAGFADECGRQMFEVVQQPSASCFAEPAHDAEVSGSRSYGEMVLADSQTYHGWVRLSEGQGWMPSASADGHDVLHCLYLEEQVARREQEQVVAERAVAEAAIERSIERDRSSKWWRKLEQPGGRAPIKRCENLSIDLPAVNTGHDACNPLGLPTQEFEAAEDVPLRAEAGHGAPVCGVKRLGGRVRATEETFDGWVKLADEPGWAFRGEQLPTGETSLLVPIGEPIATVSSNLSRMPGRQMFEVVDEAGLPIFREPAAGALALGRRAFGEFVLADTQTYHGWVRLSDDEGWMLGISADGAVTLLNVRPDELQLATSGPTAAAAASSSPEVAEATAAALAEAQKDAARRDALRQLEAAASGANTANFCAALEVARQMGVAKRDIARCNALRTNR